MGDPGHAAPAALQEIASRIADLSKWREIFSSCGLEINSTTHQQGPSSAGRGAPGAGQSPGPQPPSAVPRPLLLPQGAGGRPISPDAATRLQQLLFGGTVPLFSCEWAAARFSFHPPRSRLAYALQAAQGGTRAILAAVQAHIIAFLLFTRETECTHLARLRRLGHGEQGRALATALAETLWAAGGGGRAVVCLVTAPVPTMPREGCRANSVTERIRLFEFSEKAAAQEFISDHINCFRGEGSHGVILFLYSLLFSRTLERVQEDLGDAAPLLNISAGNITCTEAVLSLLLTGRASPRQLGGGGGGGGGREPEPGAGDGGGGGAAGPRGRVGFLRWERARRQRQVSPGLRTPRLPVWLCSLSGRLSVLFGTDSRLLSDWKAERIFHLYFYSGQQEQTQTARLTIVHILSMMPQGLQYPFDRSGSSVLAVPSPSLPRTPTLLSSVAAGGSKQALATLIRITGKRLRGKAPAAQGGGAQPWRWQSGPSGQERPSAGTGQTPSSEEGAGWAPAPAGHCHLPHATSCAGHCTPEDKKLSPVKQPLVR
ncbi:inactive ubiquitin carboxyl-terminal hydrolase MINDY-4B [Melozone crissalis]|uniref:inactive ubiquitin carboxyl-terminal hydrolase MINDY-4B n=1 Tax=Melozone crissalis TaxID=40204 RepID=UPI0023DC8404|nr:inactive ubiquitin carboxyl-terminal hydrolase MINDY-4B [Melozone crissalis]